MINQNMGKIIDEIRTERKLSREDLCEDIMSIRNYQRFISEEVNVSNDKLSKLIDRLNLDYFTLREIYTHRSEDKYSKLQRIYTLMQANSDKQAYEELKKIKAKEIDSTYMELFYNYLKLDLERQLGITPYEESISLLSELIDFPNILEYEVLNFIELNTLAVLNGYYIKKEDRRIVDFLYNLIKTEQLGRKGLIASFLPALYTTTAQSFGTLKEYEKALEICDKGIKESMSLQLFSGLYHLLYFKSISHMKLGQDEESLEARKRLYALVHALDEEDKIREYLPIFENAYENELELNFKELKK